MNNLVLFNKDGVLKRYSNVKEILEEFYELKHSYYEKRKEYLISKNENELELVTSKLEFIEGMVSGKVELRGLKKKEMCEKLKKLGFKEYKDMRKVKSTKKAVVENDDEEDTSVKLEK